MSFEGGFRLHSPADHPSSASAVPGGLVGDKVDGIQEFLADQGSSSLASVRAAVTSALQEMHDIAGAQLPASSRSAISRLLAVGDTCNSRRGA